MIRRVSRTRVSYVIQDSEYNTQHHAPVQALALDDTSIGPSGSRGGVLYSGGRDGAVLSWDTNLALDYVPPVPAGSQTGISGPSRIPSSSFGSRGHRYTLSGSSSQLQLFRQGHTRGSSTGQDPTLHVGTGTEGPLVLPIGGDAINTDAAGRTSSLRVSKPPQLQSPVTRRTFSVSSAGPVQPPGIAVETKRRRYKPERTTHKNSFLFHSDWVNDLVLVDGNRSCGLQF